MFPPPASGSGWGSGSDLTDLFPDRGPAVADAGRAPPRARGWRPLHWRPFGPIRWGVDGHTEWVRDGQAWPSGAVGVILVPRSSRPRTSLSRVVSTTVLSLALATTGLAATTSAAEAAWSRPGDLVKYRVCRDTTASGDHWVFTSRVLRYHRTPDARASISVHTGNRRVARWRTGWLDRGAAEVATVRARKAPGVRVVLTMEAGDRDSDIGTASEGYVLRPSAIRRCG